MQNDEDEFQTITKNVWLTYPRKLSCCCDMGLPMVVDSAKGAVPLDVLKDIYLRLEFIFIFPLRREFYKDLEFLE